MTVTPDTRVCRARDASWQEIESETVLLAGKEEKLLGLNAVAGRIWHLADGSRTAGQIAGEIARAFDAPRARIEQDTVAFLQLLADRGLLQAEGS